MNRKLFSLAGVLIAVFSFTVSGADAEAELWRTTTKPLLPAIRKLMLRSGPQLGQWWRNDG